MRRLMRPATIVFAALFFQVGLAMLTAVSDACVMCQLSMENGAECIEVLDGFSNCTAQNSSGSHSCSSSGQCVFTGGGGDDPGDRLNRATRAPRGEGEPDLVYLTLAAAYEIPQARAAQLFMNDGSVRSFGASPTDFGRISAAICGTEDVSSGGSRLSAYISSVGSTPAAELVLLDGHAPLRIEQSVLGEFARVRITLPSGRIIADEQVLPGTLLATRLRFGQREFVIASMILNEERTLTNGRSLLEKGNAFLRAARSYAGGWSDMAAAAFIPTISWGRLKTTYR